MMKYRIIYADPPWKYEKTGGITNSRGMAKQFYQTMSLDELCALPVRNIIDDNAALFLWTTWPQLERAFTVIRAWGFIYFGLGFEWIKKTTTGKDHFGMGYYTRANSEPCLMSFRGKMIPLCHNLRQIVEAPIQEHSRKPGEVRDKIVQLFGDLPRIELFARTRTPGWDVWGNELENDIELTLPVSKPMPDVQGGRRFVGEMLTSKPPACDENPPANAENGKGLTYEGQEIMKPASSGVAFRGYYEQPNAGSPPIQTLST